MPFALVFVGIVLLVAGVRDKQGDLFTLAKGDFTGKNNFFFWSGSILAVGAVGYIPRLKPVSDGFLVLVVVVLFLHNKGFFAQFSEALKTTETAPAPAAKPSTTAAPSGSIWDMWKKVLSNIAAIG
jgi:hypothetical protein